MFLRHDNDELFCGVELFTDDKAISHLTQIIF